MTIEIDNTLARFASLAIKHDLTHAYSDDHSKWSEGVRQIKELRAIYNAQDLHTKRLLVDVWNTIVNTKVRAPEAAQWYWTEPEGGSQ